MYDNVWVAICIGWIPAQELDKLSEGELQAWQGIAEMLALGEASGAGGQGVDVSEAPWDGSCPAGSSEGKNGAQSERLTGSGAFGAQLEGQVLQTRKPEDRQFWRQGAKPREVVRAWWFHRWEILEDLFMERWIL